MLRGVVLAAACLVALAAPGTAHAQHVHDQPAPDTGWGWSAETTAFLTANLQERRFRDFHQVESQNWMMGRGVRRVGDGTLTLHGMFSLEPFTLRALGSAQAFQTGETLDGAPLIDYQHPHDLIMGLSASYGRLVGPLALSLHGGVVDEPALGPTAFMHRASAMPQPTAPLAHHQLDSTHITHGAITAGVRRGMWMVETSVFRGREPDEDRVALDLGALDSYALRGSWMRGDLRAQVSVGWLEEPHLAEPGDVTRWTASLEQNGRLAGRDVALTVAWGQNRHQLSTENAWLAELAVAVRATGAVYARGEIVDKHILGAGGLHPPGFEHPHQISTVAALTGGYSHDLARRDRSVFSVGADVTGHIVPTELQEAYGRPVSVHLFARWGWWSTSRRADRSLVSKGRRTD